MTSISLQPTILTTKSAASQSGAVDNGNDGGAAFGEFLGEEIDSSRGVMAAQDASPDVDDEETNDSLTDDETATDIPLLDSAAMVANPPLSTTIHDKDVSANVGNMVMRPEAVLPKAEGAGANHILMTAFQSSGEMEPKGEVGIQRNHISENVDLSRIGKTQLAVGALAEPKSDEASAMSNVIDAEVERPILARSQMATAPAMHNQLRKEFFTTPAETTLNFAAQQAVSVDARLKDAPRHDLMLSKVAEGPKGGQLTATFATPPVSDGAVKVVAEMTATVEKNNELEIAPMGFNHDRGAATSIAASELRSQSPAGQTEVARHAATQIAVAITSHAKGTTEIALNPEELGKVKLTLSVQDNAITLSVQAERPETSDLLRRHVDALGQEFKSMGYNDVTFSFGQPSNGDTQGEVGATPQSHATETEADIILEQAQQPTRLANGGLDLRM